MAKTLVKRREVKDVIEGKVLLSARESRGLSQEDLAERVTESSGRQVYQMMISRWEGEYEFEVRQEVSAALNAILE